MISAPSQDGYLFKAQIIARFMDVPSPTVSLTAVILAIARLVNDHRRNAPAI